MRFEKMIDEVRLELSEAKIAHKEKADRREKACLVRVEYLIDKYIEGK